MNCILAKSPALGAAMVAQTFQLLLTHMTVIQVSSPARILTAALPLQSAAEVADKHW